MRKNKFLIPILVVSLLFISLLILIHFHCLRGNINLSDEDIDLYVLHQGSKFMIEKVGSKITQNIMKLPFDIVDTGNTVSSSIPLILESHINNGLKNIIICGFGVGLSCASSFLKQNK